MSRLLPPAVAMLAVWTGLAAALEALGPASGEFATGLHIITVPLWFLGVYLLIVLAAPTMMRLHRRFGLWPVVGVLAILTAGVDALALGSAVPGMWLVGYANMLFVWLAVHQLGYGYADGTLARGGRRLAAALALGGLRAAACGRQGGARRLWPAPRRAPGQRWWAGIRSGRTRAGRRTPRFTARPAPA